MPLGPLLPQIMKKKVMHQINKIVLMQQKLFSVCASLSILRCFEMMASPWSKKDLFGPQCIGYKCNAIKPVINLLFVFLFVLCHV